MTRLPGASACSSYWFYRVIQTSRIRALAALRDCFGTEISVGAALSLPICAANPLIEVIRAEGETD